MILIVGEVKDGKLSRSTLESVSAALHLETRTELSLLLLGDDLTSAANEAALMVPQVLVCDQQDFATFDAEHWSFAVAEVAAQAEATCVVLPASRAGREYSARVAVRLDASLLEDVVTLERTGGVVRCERYSYLARVKERIEAKRPISIITVKQGVFPMATDQQETGEQFAVSLEVPAARVKVTGLIRERASGPQLAEADIIVSGGRGVGSPEGFRNCVEALANRLGAAVGATRAVVDEGWRPYAEQVGQTGKTVQPALYVALGISGAVQHLSGMSKSRFIVAVNRDANAPIFRVSDFGIVGDAQQVIAAVLEKLN